MNIDVTIRDRHYSTLDELIERKCELHDETGGELLRDVDKDEWNEISEAIREFETRQADTRRGGNLQAGDLTRTEDDNSYSYAFEQRIAEAARSVPAGQRQVFTLGDEADAGWFARAAGDRITHTRSVDRWSERALSTTTVPVAEDSAPLFDLLRPSSIALQSGIQTLPTSAGTVTVPVITGASTAFWTAENAAITPSDPIFSGSVVVARKLATLVQASNESIEDSDPDILQVLRNELVTTAASALDRAIFLGTGASNQPLGMHFTSNIQTLSVGAFTNFTGWGSAVSLLETENAARPYSWAAHPAVVRKMREIRVDAGGTVGPHFFPIGDESVPTLWGTTGYMSTQLNGGTAYLYSPASIKLVERVPFQVEIDRSRLFNSDQSEIRLRGRFAVAVTHPKAVVRADGIA